MYILQNLQTNNEYKLTIYPKINHNMKKHSKKNYYHIWRTENWMRTKRNVLHNTQIQSRKFWLPMGISRRRELKIVLKKNIQSMEHLKKHQWFSAIRHVGRKMFQVPSDSSFHVGYSNDVLFESSTYFHFAEGERLYFFLYFQLTIWCLRQLHHWKILKTQSFLMVQEKN